jgi:hypothetical protein
LAPKEKRYKKGTSYYCSGVDKAAVICQLHAIIDHYLLGEGSWPVPTESLPSLYKTFRESRLNEDSSDDPKCEQSTALGIELQFRLLLAFMGTYEMWEIPGILEESGYLKESEAEEIYWHLPPVQAERKIRRYVVRAYLEHCNRSLRSH